MYLAQFNIAWMKFPYDDPRFDPFKAWLKSLHALANADPDFVWRYEGERDNDGYIKPYPEQPLVLGNLSIWRNFRSLKEFTFTDGHLEIMRHKRDWFEPPDDRPYSVMWWMVEKDVGFYCDPLTAAKKRLEILKTFGPGPAAFTFKNPWLNTSILEDAKLTDLLDMHGK